jgi:hypothetical protein
MGQSDGVTSGSGQGGSSAASSSTSAGPAASASAGGESGSPASAGSGGSDGQGGSSGAGSNGMAGTDGMSGGAGGNSCDDSGSVTVGCDDLDSTESCSLVTQREQCNEVATFLKPRLANQARTCMLELSDVELCGPGNLTLCIRDALMQSCPDSTATAVCEDVADECNGQLPNCSILISGLTSAGRQELLDCLPDFCDFDDCLQGLGLIP